MKKPRLTFRSQFESQEQYESVLNMSLPFYFKVTFVTSCIMAVFETFMLLRILMGGSSGSSIKHLHYGIVYTILLLTSVAFIICFCFWKKDFNKHKHACYIFEVFYNFVMIFWVVGIMLLDFYYHHTINTTLFTLIVIGIAVTSFINPVLLIGSQVVADFFILHIILQTGSAQVINFISNALGCIIAAGAFTYIKKQLFLKQYQINDVELKQLNTELRENQILRAEQYKVLNTIASIFNSMHVINLVDDTVEEFNAKDRVKEIVNHKNGASEMMNKVMTTLATEDCRENILKFTDLTTVADRMINKSLISTEFTSIQRGWCMASFITMEADENGKPTKVIFSTRRIEDEKKNEERLIKKANTDELTGLYNRRAYEEDIYQHNDIPDDDFIYLSIDINGLKVINDTKGHVAGDELITGTCSCMEKTLAPYGKVYRIGGDEFVAILICDENKLAEVLNDFDDTLARWTGKNIDKLSVSYGYAAKKDNPDMSVKQLGNIAEKKMYEAKSAYYRKTGVDRRGQQDAHKALCKSYTKILKINLSDDSYNIINILPDEQTDEKGFAGKISEWLSQFGKTGQVHPEDLDEYLKQTDIQYLKDYFNSDNNKALHIFYRRKFDDKFKKVMMEIIPTSDYSSENQSLFLYVKEL